ncbi:hypothetical protein GIB67_022183 [Kingdonia uniflora]|uniref:GDSL esterase/lipase n=1 Tax=Kingdonia uniflora TaxID=39325 RepID=A0A7J7MWF6_9MAGN|nr:hypothetical protein GIB67_022183 [Kingdonia uniflora]
MTQTKPNSLYLLIIFTLFTSFFGCSCCCTCNKHVHGAETSGMFVFGSSLVDNGNNNYVENSTARADYLPYGIDFPLGPSGRFTNGKNVIDTLGKLLKLPFFIPVFANPETRGVKIVHGVNYASGGSGILDETGSISGRVISLNQQIRNFEEVSLPSLGPVLGCENATILAQALADYLFVMGSGGNDYLMNYFLPTSIHKSSLEDFTTNLIAELSNQIKKLHQLGARKFVLISIYPLGCIPVVKAKFPQIEGCIETLNQAASLFNSHLKSLVDLIKPELPNSNLVYLDSYDVIRDIIQDPVPKGFTETSKACCEVSLITEGGNGILCKRKGKTCAKRDSFVFFDGLHPTEAVNNLIALNGYAFNLKTEAYPFNVEQLAKL